MAAHSKQWQGKSQTLFRAGAVLSYWLAWLLLVLGLFYGMHRYLEYRNSELDKRLERLR